MAILFSVFFFLLGLIVGSFLNVVILRYNTGRGVNGRSGCFSCGTTLGWYELIPVMSFVFQGGRCRTCKAKLSWQYPLVELLTGFLFLAVFLKYLPMFNLLSSASMLLFFAHIFYFFIIFSILVVIFVYDLRHKIIPNGLVYAFAVLALLRAILSSGGSLHLLIWNLVAGPLLFAPFFLLWLVSRGRWMGFGDAKLAIGIGWLLGTGLGISAIVIGFWLGAIVGLILLFICRLNIGGIKLTIKSEIPFAPFLIAGIILVYFTNLDVVGIHRIFGI